MTGKTERVVLVKGGPGKWYEQAIFIVNTNATENMPIDFVAEAEKIISDYNLDREDKARLRVHSVQNNYLGQNKKTAPYVSGTVMHSYENDRPSILLGVLMTVACLVIVGVLVFGLLN